MNNRKLRKTCPQSLLDFSQGHFRTFRLETFPFLSCVIDAQMSAYVTWRVCFSHPPEVFPVGQFGYAVFGVDFSLQGAETSPLGNVLLAENTCHLEDRPNKSSQQVFQGVIEKQYCIYSLFTCRSQGLLASVAFTGSVTLTHTAP